jgi:penicillin-binding protein 1C
VDGRLQRAIEELAAREARWLGDGANLAIVVVETRDRAVRAWLGGADFFGANGQVDLARARRSPGSALKPFIYALAFDDGIAHPETMIDDAPVRFGDYAPRNFDREFQGEVTIRHALQQSLNVPAIVALDRIGTPRFVALLREGGATLEFDRNAEAPSLPLALGGVGISLADLTMLYTALADGGLARPLRVRADAASAPARRLIGTGAAWEVVDILSGVVPPEPWAQAKRVGDSRRIAYKTGTSYGFRDAWAVGMTSTWTVGVWVGRADGTPRPGQYGRTAAAPILFKAFDLLPGEDLAPAPPQDVVLVNSAAQLPPSLRKLATTSDLGALRRERAPRILFPPDGATIELPRDHGHFATVALKAEGSGALDWVVNGTPLAQGAANSFWQPDSEGFARIVVLDRAGRSAIARIRVVPTPD